MSNEHYATNQRRAYLPPLSSNQSERKSQKDNITGFSTPYHGPNNLASNSKRKEPVTSHTLASSSQEKPKIHLKDLQNRKKVLVPSRKHNKYVAQSKSDEVPTSMAEAFKNAYNSALKQQTDDKLKKALPEQQKSSSGANRPLQVEPNHPALERADNFYEKAAPARSFSRNEQDRLNRAARDAVFQDLPPTEAEVNLGAKYQAIQKQDMLAESIVAQKKQEPLRMRETMTCNLSAEQATAIISNELHLLKHTPPVLNNYGVIARSEHVDKLAITDKTQDILNTEVMTSTTHEALGTQNASCTSNEGPEKGFLSSNAMEPLTSGRQDNTAVQPQESTSISDLNSSLSQAITIPEDFMAKALKIDYCRKLVEQARQNQRMQEDKILGERYELKQVRDSTFIYLEEEIFGPGFHEDERRLHLMLEFLIVLASQKQNDPMNINQCDKYGCFAFFRRLNLRLRQILFNNPELAIIASNKQITDEQKWQQWLEQFALHSKLEKTQEDNSEQNENDLASNIPLSLQFEQLKEECKGKFDRFVTLVNVLRAWSFAPKTDHQWSTMFLFPFGYDALFMEVNKEGKVKQNLMHGAGHIIFSMLARALNHRANSANDTKLNLGQLLVQRFFADYNGLNKSAQCLGGGDLDKWAQSNLNNIDKNPWSQLHEVYEQATLTQVQQASTFEQRKRINVEKNRNSIFDTRYVPYRYLPRYGLLLEDFEAITSLDLTKQDLFMHLSAVGMLHLLCFLLEQEQKILTLPLAEPNGENCDDDDQTSYHDINMVLLINPESKDNLRHVACKRFEENKDLFAKARAHYISAHLSSIVAQCAPELLRKKNLSEDEQMVLCNILRSTFYFKESIKIDLNQPEKKIISPDTKKEQKEAAIAAANTNIPTNAKIAYNDIEQAMIDYERDFHMGALHSSWSKDLGLSSQEGSQKNYYTLSNELLYTLVLCLVKKGKPMPVADFLRKLHERYHLVIGQKEAQNMRYPVEEREFKANEDQFKLKLKCNNLLINLSDSCEYVRNPFN